MNNKNNWEEEFDKKFPISHYYCEDGWYSCPKAEEGCANDMEGDECNCGAETYNIKLIHFITEQIKEAEQRGYILGMADSGAMDWMTN